MMSDANSNLLFVYGTLRSAFANEISNVLAQSAIFAGEGFVHGRLFNLGSYPGLVLSEANQEVVRGELYELALGKRQAVLDLLDDYEGCGPSKPEPHEYRRELVDVFSTTAIVKAWAYLLNRPTDDLEPIKSGDYLAWRTTVDKKGNEKGPSV
jgi:gamma-glutamylcyclotransferase (GGCT)/AIG2-like uncharacterized protein YtfP